MMLNSYRQYFALQKEPFAADIPRKEILETKTLTAVHDRIHYAMRLGGIALVTGEIGSGKSTALRYVIGGILELYRQILAELGVENAGISRVKMTRRIQREVQEWVTGKKMKIALMIDEASLLRLEVFAELHTLTQFEQDSKPFLPIILAGQANLIDNLLYRNSQS